MRKLISLILLLFTAAALVNAQGFCQRHKSVDPIVLENVRNITIKGDSINGEEEPCITLKNCANIHITNCFLGNSTRVAIFLTDCADITIDNSYWTNVSTGVYAVNSYAISVTHCEGKNMKGPFPRGAFVQFDNVSGPRCRVNYNKFENILGQSHPEDAISIYKSNGVAYDPIQVIGNQIRGGGPSNSGGGIMLGDKGGSYQVAKNNILVNPGQYGMAISGGTHNAILDNKIYSKAFLWTNVGIYIWAQGGVLCGMNEISGNQVSWKGSDGTENDSWDKGNCEPVIGWGAKNTNDFGANIDETILPKQLISPCNK